MKTVKILLTAFGVFVVLVGGLVAYIAATFDPNAYKPQIIQLVQQHTQRTLRLDGDIKLALWPGIGADLGRLSLSERNSDKRFVAVEALRFSLKLLPLLSKQLVVDEVTVRGARINLARGRDGRMSFDDLLGLAPASPGKPEQQKPQPPAGGGSQQFVFDIDRVVIADSMLEFRDEAAGTRYTVSKLNLKTGRIASGVPADIDLALVAQGGRPKLDLAVGLKTRLVFDAQNKTGTLEQLALEIRGQAADVSKLDLRAAGNVRMNSGGGEFAAEKLAVTATGMQGKDAFDLKLDVPAVTGSTKAFKAGALTVDAGLKQGERTIRLRLTSPVNGNLQAQQFSLPQLKAGLSATGPDLPGQSISGDLAGTASADIGKQNLRLDLAGKLAGSAIKARLGVAGFGPSVFSFDVDLDQLDIDRLLPAAKPPAKGVGASPAAKSAAAPAQPFDLSALKTLRANGSIRIGALTASNLKMQNVRAVLKAGGGRVAVNPLAAGLYQGTLSGAAAVDAGPAVPVFTVRQTLTGVSIAPLLKDLADNETLEGKGTISVDVTARGSTVDALKRALDGTAAMRLTDGALRGIDIGGAIRSAKARLGVLKGEQTQQADAQQKTDFSELTATFRIADGVARNNDLSMKSPLLRVGGEGTVNIGRDTIDYLVKASIVGTSKGQGGRDADDLRGVTIPVRITGPLKAPSYKLDFGAMITDTARQKVEDAVKKRLLDRLAPQPGTSAPEGAKSGGSARDALKGLFGR